MKNLDDKQAYIFDMDGTLVNSEPIGPQTFAEIYESHGVEVNETEIAEFTQSWRRIGDYVPQDEYMTRLAQQNNIDESIVSKFYELYKQNLLHAKSLPGVDYFLKKSKQQNKLLVVVSASKRSQIETVLNNNHWLELFDFIVGEEDVSAHKPSPEGYIYAIEKLGLTNSQVAIFEDSKNGVLAAKAAKALTVGISAGSAPNQDISSADVVVDSFEELLL